MRTKLSLLEKYARLAVRKGVNVQKGQPLVIRASVQDYEFIRLCVKEAYKAGSGKVTINWNDEEISKSEYSALTSEQLAEIPNWAEGKIKDEHQKGACYLSIYSATPGYLKDIPQEKLNAASKAFTKKMGKYQKYTMNNIGQWSILALPSSGWAKVVFPNDSAEVAYKKLEKAIYATCRVTKDNDPIKEWKKHDAEISKHNEILTNYNFKALHFTNSLGTDLTVGLVKNHLWAGGNCVSASGVVFDPNMPTEETFCMPEKTGVEGIVYASKPLSYNGKVIEDFWFKFEKGKVVSFGAKKEKAALKKLLDYDSGSRYLGEVALISYDSPVSKTGILFFNTLFDENASCHLALGRPYPENLKGGLEMNDAQLKKAGANSSLVHEDFMFGTKDLKVDGIKYDGSIVPVFRKGNFVI